MNKDAFDAQRLLDAASGANDGVFANMKTIVCSPDIVKVMLGVVAGDSVDGKEGVKNLGGKVGKEARLRGRIDGESRVEERCDNDSRNENDTNLVSRAMQSKPMEEAVALRTNTEQ